MNQPNKSFPVSWDQFHRDSRALAWRLTGEGPFHAIVAIARGGLVPATIIARELNIRVIESVSVKSYDHQTQGEVQVLKAINPDLIAADASGRKLLIIDDPSIPAPRPAQCNMLPTHFATVYAKPQGATRSTVSSPRSARHVDLFPWDLDFTYAPLITGGTGLIDAHR